MFGVPVDYFLSSKSNNVINQLDIDITEYRNNKENNLQIIRHFYSDEWNVNYLRYTFYPKNLFLKLGLYMEFLFSESFNKAGMAAAYIYDIDKINDNYYLLRRDNMIFIAFINKDRLVVNNISNIKIKKGNIFNRTPHFVYDNKMFSIYIFSNPNDTNNKSIFWMEIKRDLSGVLLGIGIVVGVFLLIALIIFLLLLFGQIR